MKKFLKKLIPSALAAVMALSAYSLPAYAHGHGGSHHGEARHGWTEIDGKRYYYDKNGNCVTHNCTINGVRYKFDSSGVCHGAYTGWSKTNGKRFYYCGGIKECGWVHVGRDWYYIDGKNGRLTGEQTINGFSYRFDEKGCWDKAECTVGGRRVGIRDIADRVTGKMDSGIYGGYYLCDGMLVIWSVDGKAEDFVEKHHKSYGGNIVYKKADYSLNELNGILRDFGKKCPVPFTGADACNGYNRVVLYAAGENIEKLKEYVNSCGLSDQIIVLKENTEGEGQED